MRLHKNRFDYAAHQDLSSPTLRDITLGRVDKYHITEYDFITLESDADQSFAHFIRFTPCGTDQGKKNNYWKYNKI